MLKDKGVPFIYRDYTAQPLSEGELRDVLGRLGVEPAALLRTRQAKIQGITGDEPAQWLIEQMAAEPRLVQRPIALLGDRALLARPADRLEAFLAGDEA